MPDDEDEIDHLLTGFNGMLAEIEQRDSRLLVAKNVAEKAAEVNAELARQSALILNSATDGILGVDLDNRLTFINPAAERMLGMTLADIGTKTIHEAIHHSYPDGTPWPEADCVRTEAMRRGESFSAAEETFWRADGTMLVLIVAHPVIDAHDGLGDVQHVGDRERSRTSGWPDRDIVAVPPPTVTRKPALDAAVRRWCGPGRASRCR